MACVIVIRHSPWIVEKCRFVYEQRVHSVFENQTYLGISLLSTRPSSNDEESSTETTSFVTKM